MQVVMVNLSLHLLICDNPWCDSLVCTLQRRTARNHCRGDPADLGGMRILRSLRSLQMLDVKPNEWHVFTRSFFEGCQSVELLNL